MLPRPGPLDGCCNIKSETAVFSRPLSERTLEGSPYSAVAFKNAFSTVSALLLVLQLRKTGILVKPSIPPCMTSLHLLRNQYMQINLYVYGMAIKWGGHWKCSTNARHIVVHQHFFLVKFIVHQSWTGLCINMAQ